VGSLFLRQRLPRELGTAISEVSIPVWVHCSCDAPQTPRLRGVRRFNPGVGSLFLRPTASPKRPANSRFNPGVGSSFLRRELRDRLAAMEGFQSRCGFIVPATAGAFAGPNRSVISIPVWVHCSCDRPTRPTPSLRSAGVSIPCGFIVPATPQKTETFEATKSVSIPVWVHYSCDICPGLGRSPASTVSIPVWVHRSCDERPPERILSGQSFNPGVGSLFLRLTSNGPGKYRDRSFNPGVGSSFLRPRGAPPRKPPDVVSIPVWVHRSCDRS